MTIIIHNLKDYNYQLSERFLLLARPKGKSSGSGHDWPLRATQGVPTDREDATSKERGSASFPVHVDQDGLNEALLDSASACMSFRGTTIYVL